MAAPQPHRRLARKAQPPVLFHDAFGQMQDHVAEMNLPSSVPAVERFRVVNLSQELPQVVIEMFAHSAAPFSRSERSERTDLDAGRNALLRRRETAAPSV
jgi:hypothetical protein